MYNKKKSNNNVEKSYLIETSFIISININDDNSLMCNNFPSYTFNNEYFFFFFFLENNYIYIYPTIMRKIRSLPELLRICIVKYPSIRTWNSSFEYRNSIIQKFKIMFKVVRKLYNVKSF